MQVSATLLKDNKYINSLRESKFFIICLAVLLLGMFTGAVSVNLLSDSSSGIIESLFKAFLDFRTDSSFLRIFLSAFVSGMIYVFVICLSSFGVCGFPIIPFLLFVRGVGSCAVAGVLYRDYSLQGIAFANLILLPSALITDFILLYLSNEGFKLSSKFYGIIKDVSARGIEIRPECIRMLRVTLISILCISAASLIEAAFSVSFIKFFNFS